MTALEFIIEEINRKDWWHLPKSMKLEIIKQAKELEKKQIIEAHGSKLKKSSGVTNYEYWYTGEMYYNDNFKNEENGE